MSFLDLDTLKRKTVGWLALSYFIFMLNAFWPLLRFRISALNSLFFVGIQVIPWIVVFSSVHWPCWRRWGIFMIFLLPVIAESLTVLALVLFPPLWLGLGLAASASTKRAETLSMSRGTVVVYEKDGGALDYGGTYVRQECTIVPGLLAVHDLVPYQDPAHTEQMEKLDNNRVRIQISIPGENYPRSRTMRDRTVNLAVLPCLWNRK